MSVLELLRETGHAETSAAADDESQAEPQEHRPALFEALDSGNADAARNLLVTVGAAGLNYVDEGYTALQVAIIECPEDVAVGILARPEFQRVNHRNQEGATALHLAAGSNLLAVCRAILARPEFAELLALDNCGRTAAQVARNFGSDGVVDLLEGAEAAATAEADPLLEAIRRSDEATALQLLQAPQVALLNGTDGDGWPLLHRAVCRGLSAAALAILARPDFQAVNAADRFQNTALHHAAGMGLLPVCQAIVGRADFTELMARNGEGATALEQASFDLARGTRHAAVIELLRAAQDRLQRP